MANSGPLILEARRNTPGFGQISGLLRRVGLANIIL